jgi:hypothetical protein
VNTILKILKVEDFRVIPGRCEGSQADLKSKSLKDVGSEKFS